MSRYRAQHGAQIVDVDASSAEFKFYAATPSAASPTLVDCYRIRKAADGTKTYEECTPASTPAFSLLTAAAASSTDGTHGKVAWRWVAAAAGDACR